MTTVITGPCLVTYNSVTYFSQGDVTVSFDRQLTELTSSQHGRFDSRHKSAKITISFTVSGRSAEIAGALALFDGKLPGESLVPGGTGNEKALVISPLHNAGGASRIWTFTRAGLTNLGTVKVGVSQAQGLPLTFTALESIVSAGTYFTTGSYSAPSSTLVDDFDPTGIPTVPLEAVWADNPASLASGDQVLHAEDGWSIDLSVTSQEHFREECGIADITYQDMKPVITGDVASWFDYNAAAVSEQTFPTLMPFASTRPGQRATRKMLSLRALNNDTTGGASPTADGDILWQFPKAELTMMGLNWSGSGKSRYGGVRFTSTPTFTAGVKALGVVSDTQA